MVIFDTNAILRSPVFHALQVYASTTLDFVDCLLIGYAKEDKYTVFTFDKKLQKYLNKAKSSHD